MDKGEESRGSDGSKLGMDAYPKSVRQWSHIRPIVTEQGLKTRYGNKRRRCAVGALSGRQ